MADHYFGKYRGTVINNVDPLKLGRIQVMVPDVAESVPTSWAMPCFPAPGMFAVPGMGSAVWIEFETGDVAYPIWTCCYYRSSGDVPELSSGGDPGAAVLLNSGAWRRLLVIMDCAGEATDIVVGFQGGANFWISIP